MADARRAVRECLQRHAGDIPNDALFLIAVSGGADSLALAWAAASEIPKLGYRARAVIVDHQLQEGSADVAEQARATVESFGLEADVVTVSVTGDGGVENAARDARYQALQTHAETHGAHAVLLGHTLDDQAETVLLGLTRGSGPQSISGMRDVNGLWWRPFLSLRRSATEQALRDSDVAWWSDPHNTDRVFMRPRIRHDVMPVLEDALGSGVTDALARTARLVRIDSDELDAQAQRQFFSGLHPEQSINLSRRSLVKMPLAIRTRVIRLAFHRVSGRTLTETQTLAISHWLEEPQATLPPSLPGASVALKGEHILFIPNTEESEAER